MRHSLRCAFALLLLIQVPAWADSGSITVGLVVPSVKTPEGGPELTEPVRQSLIAALRSPNVNVVPLEAAANGPVDAEAQQKHCTHVLYTRIEHQHGGGALGMLKKLAPMAGALPMLGALGSGGGGGGGLASIAAQAATNAAASAAATSAQQQVMNQMSGVHQNQVKRGDTVKAEYRLLAVGSSSPIASETLKGSASADGEDIMTPLIGQMANGVAGHLGGGGGAGTAQAGPGLGTASGAPSQASAAVAQSEAASGGGMFGKFFGHKAPSQSASSPAANQIDCARIASMPHAGMTLESCQQMVASQNAYTTAASDPSAMRPGDEQMSCEQIMAELRQQKYEAPDRQKVANMQQTAQELQDANARSMARGNALAAKQQAETNAYMAASAASTAATGGLVDTSKFGANEFARKQYEEQRRVGEADMRERDPTDTKVMNTLASAGTDAARQLNANPRMARLVQLANAQRCKGS